MFYVHIWFLIFLNWIAFKSFIENFTSKCEIIFLTSNASEIASINNHYIAN